MHINRRELFTVLLITAAVFAVSNLSYIDKDSPFSSQFAAEMFIIRTLVDLSGMAVLFNSLPESTASSHPATAWRLGDIGSSRWSLP